MTIRAIDWVAQHARFKPESVAMVELPSTRQFTYAQMHDRVGRVAAMLQEHGIQAGDRVAFLMLNSTDILEIIFGCWRIGAVCLALNYRLTSQELSFILNDSETSMLIHDEDCAPLLDGIKKECDIGHYMCSDGMGGASAYEMALAAVRPVTEMLAQTLETQCLLMYSSGTTGRPKGVIITHGMMYFSSSSGVRVGGLHPGNVSLSNMPLFHIGALNVMACPAIWVGARAVIMRQFDPKATLDVIADPVLEINSLFMVPAALNALRLHPQAESTDFSRIETALTGGAPVPTEIVEWWYKRGVVIQEGYGMTETTGIGCVLCKTDIPQRVGWAGQALMHSEIKIVNELGQTCGPDEVGELWLRGAAITSGYWRREEANKESFVDGWFRSGDVARMDARGYIKIEDRIKDMYISGGENVYPAEIENLLYQMPQIQEVAVIGVPDERWGETGCVVAVVRTGEVLSLEDVLTHLKPNLANFKLPQYVHVIEILPRNAAGKVLKFTLRKMLPDALGMTRTD